MGVELIQGVYPLQFKLRANLKTVIQNTNLQENISDVFISSDYNLLHRKYNSSVSKCYDPLWLEGFAFLSRTSNTYIAIDQRYESGVGLVFNKYLFKTKSCNNIKDTNNLLNSDGNKLNIKIKQIKLNDNQFNNLKFEECYNEICKVFDLKTLINDDEIKSLNNSKYNHYFSNIKKNAKFRFAIATGIYYEFNKARLEYKYKNNNNNIDTLESKLLPVTNKLRYEVRPTVSIQSNENFTFRIDYYFKARIGQKDTVFYEKNKNYVDVLNDHIHEITTSMFFKVDKNLEFALKYNYIFYKAPSREYRTAYANGIELAPILYKSPNSSRYFDISLIYKI